MAWKIEIDSAAVRDLDKLDPQATRRILVFLHERVAALEDPRSIGEALIALREGCAGEYLRSPFLLPSLQNDINMISSF